ncbi:MAG: hypothetical protein ACRDJ4_02770 [Actinomycetota bacterium]
MAITEDRLDEVRTLEERWERPEPVAEPPRLDESPLRVRRFSPDRWAATGRVPARWAGAIQFAWAATVTALYLLEPTPAEAGATPVWVELLATGFLLALLATFFGLATRRRWGAGSSLVAATFGIGIAAACFATGHHAGLWPAYELAAFTGLAGLSVVGLRRS